jgi:DNA-binding MarR family transcriptional regulator
MSANPTRDDLFGRVFVLLQHLSRRVDLALAPVGLTSRQWLLLAVLTRGFPGAAPTLSEAAALFGTSRQNVKQIAVQLVARGYLALDVDPADARATRLRLTARVAELDAPDVVAGQVAVLDELFACFTPEEVAVLADLTGRWIEHLQRLQETS